MDPSIAGRDESTARPEDIEDRFMADRARDAVEAAAPWRAHAGSRPIRAPHRAIARNDSASDLLAAIDRRLSHER
jgi:hypothetical protein